MDYQALLKLYTTDRKSVREIAHQFGCSESRVNYWLKKYKIPKRSISEAIYQSHNPTGHPFTLKKLKTSKDFFLFGLGVGLYWGEGTKSNLNSVRLGNTDPDLLKNFILFLEKLYGIKKDKLRFGVQVFTDLAPAVCLKYWCSTLDISPQQFYKPVISKSQSRGTYRRKAQYGVITIYFNNTKLRDILTGEIEKLRRK
jgi:hypothetical protein